MDSTRWKILRVATGALCAVTSLGAKGCGSTTQQPYIEYRAVSTVDPWRGAFYVDHTGQLWSNRGKSSSVDWQLIGNSGAALTGGLAVAQAANGHLAVWTTAEDGHLWNYYYTPATGAWAWSDEGQPGCGAVVGRPAIAIDPRTTFLRSEQPTGDDIQVQRQRGWIRIFVRCANGDLADLYWDTNWVWEDLRFPGPGKIWRDPGATIDSRFVGAVALSDSGNLHTVYSAEGGPWQWANHGAPQGAVDRWAGSSPAIVATGGGQLLLFAHDTSGNQWVQYRGSASSAQPDTWRSLGLEGCSSLGSITAIADSIDDAYALAECRDRSRVKVTRYAAAGTFSSWTMYPTKLALGPFGEFLAFPAGRGLRSLPVAHLGESFQGFRAVMRYAGLPEGVGPRFTVRSPNEDGTVVEAFALDGRSPGSEIWSSDGYIFDLSDPNP